MSDSVAGKIRIDLLTNYGKFTAEMRSAGRDGLGGFKEEFDRTMKGFNTQKAVQQRISGEQTSWKNALVDINKDRSIFNPQDTMTGRFGDFKPDMALKNQQRWKEMIPWGNSLRVELSREAAETAAAIGGHKQNVIGSLAEAETNLRSPSFFRGMSGVGKAALGRGPLAPLSAMGFAIEDMSVATKGLGLFTAGLLIAHAAAASLGREIEATREKANSMGQTYDQFVKRHGLPEHSRFVEGGALAAEKGWIGLKGAGAGIWGGVVNTLGHTDVSQLAAMARNDEEGRLKNRQADQRNDQVLQSGESLGAMRRELAGIKGISNQLAREEWIKTFNPTPRQIEMWDDLANSINKVKAAKAAESIAESNFNLWRDATKGRDGESTRQDKKYFDDATKGGRSQSEARNDLKLFHQRASETESLGRADSMRNSLISPEEKYKHAIDDIDVYERNLRNRSFAEQRQGHETIAKMRMVSLEDYYREAFKLDKDRIRESLKSDTERTKETVDNLFGKGRDLGLSNKEISGAADKEVQGLRGRLGIRDPARAYEDSLKELNKARSYGDKIMTADEYDKRRKELRDQAAGAMTGDTPRTSTTPAMEAFSQAAYSTVANARAAATDPKLAEIRTANAKLDSIDQRLKLIPAGETL